MRTQQMDPMAQAMQILQFITQRRGQQAEIEQGNRRLDLQEAQQQMAGEQFGQQMEFNQQGRQQDALQFAREMALRELAQRQGAQQFGKRMTFDEQQAQMAQQRFEEEQRQRILDRARGMSEFERQLGATTLYQQAALEENQRQNAAALLQAQLMSGNLNAIERSRLQDQYDAAMQQWYGKMLPLKRDYTPDELKTIQIFQ